MENITILAQDGGAPGLGHAKRLNTASRGVKRGTIPRTWLSSKPGQVNLEEVVNHLIEEQPWNKG